MTGMLRMVLAPAIICVATPAFADLQVRMPTVDYLELEFEHNGLVNFDSKGSPLHNPR